jgi:hypothetical protein
VLSTQVLDLGPDLDELQLVLANIGGELILWQFSDDLAPFVPSATQGALGPGQVAEVRIAIDREGMPEGDVHSDVAVQVTSGGEGEHALSLLASVEHAPVVRVVRAPSSLNCPNPAGLVTVTVTDEAAITSVELVWFGPGVTDSFTMTASGGGWSGRLTPEAVDGQWTWGVDATDARGNVGTATAPFVVVGC